MDPVFYLALTLMLVHGVVKQHQLREARAAAMRRHPSSRRS